MRIQFGLVLTGLIVAAAWSPVMSPRYAPHARVSATVMSLTTPGDASQVDFLIEETESTPAVRKHTACIYLLACSYA